MSNWRKSGRGFRDRLRGAQVGLNAAAVPVRDHTGAIIGPQCVRAGLPPRQRTDRGRADDLKEAGILISRRMGWLG